MLALGVGMSQHYIDGPQLCKAAKRPQCNWDFMNKIEVRYNAVPPKPVPRLFMNIFSYFMVRGRGSFRGSQRTYVVFEDHTDIDN